MVDELLYGDQLLAKWPDNTQGLVSAQAGREGWGSIGSAVGAVVSLAGGTVPAGVDVDINNVVNPTYLGGQGFEMDGNGALYHSYNQFTVPAGYSRITKVQAQFVFESSNNTLTTFVVMVNGVELAYTRIGVEWTTQTVPMPISIFGWTGLDVSAGDRVSIGQDKATGSGIIGQFSMSAVSYIEVAAAASGNFFQGVNWE